MPSVLEVMLFAFGGTLGVSGHSIQSSQATGGLARLPELSCQTKAFFPQNNTNDPSQEIPAGTKQRQADNEYQTTPQSINNLGQLPPIGINHCAIAALLTPMKTSYVYKVRVALYNCLSAEKLKDLIARSLSHRTHGPWEGHDHSRKVNPPPLG